jgi:hypothetical protein
MAELESWASQLLRPLIRGESSHFDPEEQESLAIWAIKTAFAVEWSYSSENRMIPDQHPKALFRASNPPLGSSVYSARVPGGTGIWHRSLRLPMQFGKTRGRSYDYVSSFSIDELFLQVVGISVGTGLTAESNPPASETERVWPPATDEGYDWPCCDFSFDERESAAMRWQVTGNGIAQT